MIKEDGTKFSTPNINFFAKNYVIKISAKVNDACSEMSPETGSSYMYT